MDDLFSYLDQFLKSNQISSFDNFWNFYLYKCDYNSNLNGIYSDFKSIKNYEKILFLIGKINPNTFYPLKVPFVFIPTNEKDQLTHIISFYNLSKEKEKEILNTISKKDLFNFEIVNIENAMYYSDLCESFKLSKKHFFDSIHSLSDSLDQDFYSLLKIVSLNPLISLPLQED